jgi:hypothetical protein
MTGLTTIRRLAWVFALSAAAAGASINVSAAEARRGDGSSQHLDARYQHNHYYPARGAAVRELPSERVVVNHGRDRFFVSGGVWYRPYGPRFVVVRPPYHLFVPILPPFYTTLWFGGIPYYYANDTYYVWRDQDNGYETVPPPPNAEDVATQQPTSDDVFIYPKNGQTQDQQDRDRYECHRWAVGQSAFDPTQAGGGAPGDDSSSKRGDYRRAMGACLEGRGYSVK